MTVNGVIISGGSLAQAFALAFLRNNGIEPGAVCSRLLAADRGLVFCHEHGLIPTCIVGDFDSAGTGLLESYRSLPGVQIRTFRPEKDWTDTEIAVSTGIELGWKTIDVLGGTGTRLDHVLGNIQVMEMAARQGVQVRLIDPYNRITLHQSGFSMKKSEQWGSYVSLIPWGGPVRQLTLRGFKYPLDHFTLKTGASLGISNEIIQETAEVSFTEGMLLAAETKDQETEYGI